MYPVPSFNLTTDCTNPLPKVVVPTEIPSLLSTIAAVNISAAEALSPLVNTTIGSPNFSLSDFKYSVFPLLSFVYTIVPSPINSSATSLHISSIPPGLFLRSITNPLIFFAFNSFKALSKSVYVLDINWVISIYPKSLSITLLSILFSIIWSVFTLKFNCLSSLNIVSSTVLPFLPFIIRTASSEFLYETDFPLTFTNLSPDFTPAFSAGESFMGTTTKPPSFDAPIYIPTPT